MEDLHDYGMPENMGSCAGFSACNIAMNTMSQSSSENQSAPTNTTDAGSDTAHLQPLEDTTHLTEIILALDGIVRKLPSAQVSHDQVQSWLYDMERLDCLHESLERILHYCQRLLVIYPKVLKAAAGKSEKAVDGVQSPNPSNTDDENYTNMQHYAIWPQKLDLGLLNLLIACHHRLLDVFDVVVNHGHICGQATAHLPGDQEPRLDIPEARIGSFVVPKGAAASMFMATVVELQTLLVKRAKDLGDLASSASYASKREVQMLKLQGELIQDRTNDLLDSLRRLKTEVFDKLFKAG